MQAGSSAELEYPTVSVSSPSAHVRVVTMNFPPVNALGWELRGDLTAAFRAMSTDDDVRCVVLTGVGRSFTAGADLRQELEIEGSSQQAEYSDHFGELLDAVENFRTPVIAAINGHTVGGGLEFALCCDIRMCVPEAKFVAAGVNVGLIASFWRLPNIVGHGAAKEVLLTGRKVTSDEALRWGLVTESCSADTLLPMAIAKAELIASKAPLSVEATKKSMNATVNASQEEAGRVQREEFTRMINTNDHKEAVNAFFEKREANFTRS